MTPDSCSRIGDFINERAIMDLDNEEDIPMFTIDYRANVVHNQYCDLIKATYAWTRNDVIRYRTFALASDAYRVALQHDMGTCDRCGSFATISTVAIGA